MAKKLSDEEKMQSRIDARENRDYKAFEKMSARRDAAEPMIGELMRNGQIVYYVFPVGGKYREDTRSNLIDFLVRNNYA